MHAEWSSTCTLSQQNHPQYQFARVQRSVATRPPTYRRIILTETRRSMFHLAVNCHSAPGTRPPLVKTTQLFRTRVVDCTLIAGRPFLFDFKECL